MKTLKNVTWTLERRLWNLIFFMICYMASTTLCAIKESILSYDVAFGSEITPCNKICKPLVVYRFTGNVITSITTLRT